MPVLSNSLAARLRANARWAFCCGWLVACNGGDGAPKTVPLNEFGVPADEHPGEPGQPVTLEPTAADQAEFAMLTAALAKVNAVSTEELLSQYRAPAGTLDYVPTDAQYLDLIQNSAVALDPGELERLATQGFVVSTRQAFPTFGYGYVTLYSQDLPLYVSADSLLYALHRSYDEILKSVESAFLVAELSALLEELRVALPTSSASETTRADLDFYLAVALRLLTESQAAPVAGASAKDISAFVASATAAQGTSEVNLFGVQREVDFSQFEPRGHYTDSLELQRYFRAMMWLGRIDFRLIETQSDGSQVFHRRQYEATLGIRELFGASQLERFQKIDSTIEAFVGESDYMTLPEVNALEADLGGSMQALAASDEAAAKAIIDGNYGAQRISSHIMINEVGGTLPLNRSFLVFGQRYVLDSHVFSKVVWDRTEAKRMMPNPLDAAFAALGNDAAAPLLASDLEAYQYSGNLLEVRTLADAHGAEFWNGNLYNLWLGSLRALSPSDETAGLPQVTQTEPWSRRILNTQLASWAELRHDTILYAKQSYTGGVACEFPDGYVDPYPEFYAALIRYAERGQTLTELLPESQATHWNGAESIPLKQAIEEYFGRLRVTSETLLEMANLQRDGMPYEQKHLDFLNRTVTWHPEQVCGSPPTLEGWYADLFFQAASAGEYDPTIADVHTQPTDEGGAPVGKVLHVGTGSAELFVVTVDTCSGPKAYAGLTSSYYEHTTTDFQRLNDQEWTEVLQTSPPRPAWFAQ